MQFEHTRRSRKQVGTLLPHIQKALEKQLQFLVENLRHPSLRAKKYNKAGDIWQARVTENWRFYFQIRGDTYVILSIIPHPK